MGRTHSTRDYLSDIGRGVKLEETVDSSLALKYRAKDGSERYVSTSDTPGGGGGDASIPVIEVNNASTLFHTIDPNKFYIFKNSIERLGITTTSGTSGIVNIYAFRFTAAIDNPTITLPQGVVINQDLSLKTGDVCEFSIQDNLALFSVWEAQS